MFFRNQYICALADQGVGRGVLDMRASPPPRSNFCHYRPQTKFAKVMFLQVSVCPQGGRGHAWLLRGGMRGCSRGGVLGCSGGHAWLLWGGMRGCSGGACVVAPGGACMVAPGGMRGCSGGGHVWLLWGACMVAWGACVVALGGACVVFFDEIRSMSGRYTSYWNAFLFSCSFWKKSCKIIYFHPQL